MLHLSYGKSVKAPIDVQTDKLLFPKELVKSAKSLEFLRTKKSAKETGGACREGIAGYAGHLTRSKEGHRYGTC